MDSLPTPYIFEAKFEKDGKNNIEKLCENPSQTFEGPPWALCMSKE
jgi:hypothetical protein